MANCRNCGAKTAPGEQFCKNCGQKLTGFPGSGPEKKARILFILSIVLFVLVVAAGTALLVSRYSGKDAREEQPVEYPGEEQVDKIEEREQMEPAVPPGERPQESDGAEIFAALSDEEKQSLNIFLSNFSETNFQHYDANQKYGASNSLPLIAFVHLHYHFNLQDQLVGMSKGGTQYTGLPLEKLSAKLNRFFHDLNCTPAFIESTIKAGDSGYFSDGKHLLWEMADGAQINYFSQAVSLLEKKDGTLKAQIDLYRLERGMDDGLMHGEVPDWVYRPCSMWSEANKAGATKIGAATATLARYEYLGKPSYQLVKYELLTQ